MIFFELLEKKWAYFFYLIDINKDGVLKPEDFISIVERLESSEKTEIDTTHKKWLMLQARKMYDLLASECKSRIENEISLGDWMKLLNRHRRKGDSRFLRAFKLGCVRYIFDLFDFNGDGYIDFEEFFEIYQIYGISESQIFLAFKRLDVRSEGRISRREFLVGLNAFFTSESPEDFNYIFGEYREPTPGYYRLALVG